MINIQQQQIVTNTSTTPTTIEAIIKCIESIIIEPTKASSKERKISNWN